MIKKEKILVVGAGISGLLAGRMLNQAGYEVTILEKSRGVGGRMATRRFKEGIFDHGAQFFTARDPKFLTYVNQWKLQNIAQIWSNGFSIGGNQPAKSGHPRFRGQPGMTSIAKFLAQDLDLRLQTRVKSINTANKAISVETDDGKSFFGSQLILTAPVPQSLALLKTANNFEIEPEIIQLQDFRYHACIAVLVLVDGPSAIPYPGGLKLERGPIRWLGDNTQKGISPKQTAITIHASSEFSHQNFDRVTETTAQQLISAAKPWLRSQILDWQVHKWRFSHPVQSLSRSFMKLPGRHKIFLAGDAFGAPRVEGAARSGMAVAQQIINRFDHKPESR